MILRLDSPSAQATFSNDTADGVPYTSSKFSIPISQLRYTDTVYTAPANGLLAYWFTNTSVAYTNQYDTAYIGNMPLMKMWYGNGLPPVFSIGDIDDKWSVKFKGYFRFDYLADYNFYFGGAGYVSKFEIDGTNYLSADASTTEYKLSITDTAYNTSNPYTNGTVGVWKLLEIDYEQRTAYDKSNSGLCILWDTDNTVATPEKIVMSAGVTHIFGEGVPVTNKAAIPDTAVPGYSNISLDISNDGSTLTFELPFISSNNPVSSAGFYFDPGAKIYIDPNTGRGLKKFRQISYYEGYRNTSGVNELVQKFTGQIRDFNTRLSASGVDVLEVTCHDYSMFTRETFNVDAPNPIDYIAAGYMDKVDGHVNGITKPPAFDGWELHKAFEIMCMNSYLDPYYMNLRVRKTNKLGNLVYGNYFVEPKGLSYQIYLDRDPVKYGNPTGIAPDSQVKGATLPPDATYLSPAGFGEYYQDTLNKLVSIYGMAWGVNRYGYPYLKILDSPRSYLNDRDTGSITYSGTWYQSGKNVSAFKATYSSAVSNHSSAQATFTGSKCVALVGLSPRGGLLSGGSTATPSVYAEIRYSGGRVEIQHYNLYLATAWHSYDGIYPGLGVNPCVLHVGNNLTYDTYTVHIANENSGGYELQFEGFLFYDDDLDGSKFSFRTGDSNGPGQITDLTVIDTGDDIRNEAYVLGKFLGYKYEVSPVQTDKENDRVRLAISNPNNPVGQYVQSVTRDLNSIYKSTASNFVGMPRRTLITDPSIGSQSQADYLSYNFIQQYSNPATNIEYSSLGNPLLEVNDKIFIDDDYSQIVDSSRSFWITSINSQLGGTYTSDQNATTFRPIGSFFPKPQPDIDTDFNGIPILNLEIENRGNIGHLNAALTKTQTTSIQLTTVTGLPLRGYLYLQTKDDENKIYEIIKYDRRDPDGTDPGFVYSLTRGLQYSSNKAWSSGDYVIAAYDPYLQEGSGLVPTIKFDNLINGKLYLRVLGDLSGVPVHVNTLTGIGNEDWPYAVYDAVQWGPNYVYTWDARDAIGTWNRHFITIDRASNAEQKSDMKGDAGYYVAESKDVVDPNDSSAKIPQYSKFYLDFKFIDETGRVWNYSSKRGDGELESSARVYTRRGPVGKVNFHIQFDGCHYARYSQITDRPANITTRENTIPDAIAFTQYDTSWAGGSREIPITDTSYRFHHIGVDELTPFPKPAKGIRDWKSYYSNSFGDNPFAFWQNGVSFPFRSLVYFTPTANGYDGLKTILRSGGNVYNSKTAVWPKGDNRIQELLDDDYRRRYSLELKWRRNVISVIGWGAWYKMFGTYPSHLLPKSFEADIYHEFTEGDFIIDDNIIYDPYNNGDGIVLYFNPKNLTGDSTYDFVPVGKEVQDFWDTRAPLQRQLEDFGPEHRMWYFYNYVNFFGDFTDNSGRSPIILGDIFDDPANLVDEGMAQLCTDPTDSSTAIRYDENEKPRVVGYVDYSIDTFDETYSGNNLPNLVLMPAPYYGWDYTQINDNVYKHYPPLLPNFAIAWLYKVG